MIHELTTLPTRLPSGDLYVEYVGWETSADKARMTARGYQAQPGDVGVPLRHGSTAGNLIYGQFANDHKMQLPDSAQRIKTVGTRQQQRFILRDGTRVDPSDRSEQTRQKIGQVGFDRETFARQVTSELNANIESWMTREQNRKLGSKRDRRGRLYARRDARGTTLNLQVSASGDDGVSAPDQFVTDNEFGLFIGDVFGNDRNVWCRYANVPISGVTVDSALFRVSGQDLSGSLGTTVRADSVVSSESPISEGDFNSRVRTAASVAVSSVSSGWNDYAITTVLQELADISATNILVLWDESASSGVASVKSYDQDTALAPKLDIDYTAAAASKSSLLLMGIG